MITLEEYETIKREAIVALTDQFPHLNVKNLLQEIWSDFLDCPFFYLETSKLKN